MWETQRAARKKRLTHTKSLFFGRRLRRTQNVVGEEDANNIFFPTYLLLYSTTLTCLFKVILCHSSFSVIGLELPITSR